MQYNVVIWPDRASVRRRGRGQSGVCFQHETPPDPPGGARRWCPRFSGAGPRKILEACNFLDCGGGVSRVRLGQVNRKFTRPRLRPLGVIYSISSSSRTASCLSWYSVMRSRTFLSASWNSISSIPSPLYQWRNAFLLYIAPNCVASRWKMPFNAVVFATKVQLCFTSLGGTVTTEVFMLLGIHSTKSSELALWRFSTFSSTSWVDMGPRKMREAVMYLPSSGFTLEKKFLGLKLWLVSSCTLTSWYALLSLLWSGAWAIKKKWSRGKGTKLTPSFRRSPFNLPGNRREAVTPAMTQEMR